MLPRQLLLLLAIALTGCGSSGVVDAVKQVTIAELEKETSHLVFFSYVGSDEQFHYFETLERRKYKLPRADWRVPNPLTLGMGAQFFVAVKDGKITAPDPKKMSRIAEDRLLAH